MFTTEKTVVSKSLASKNGKTWTVFTVNGKTEGTVQKFNVFDKTLAEKLPESGTVTLGLEKEGNFWTIKDVIGGTANPVAAGTVLGAKPQYPEDTTQTTPPSYTQAEAGRTRRPLSTSDHVALFVAAFNFTASKEFDEAVTVYRMAVAEVQAGVNK